MGKLHFFLTLCIVPFSAYAGDIDDFIEQARIEYNVPGVAVSIVQGNKVIYSKGFGVVRSGGAQKVDQNTIFQLASVSKTFTAAALGRQVERGLLEWDGEIIKVLPQFALKEPYPSRYASVRDLLAHRTGLPAFGGDLLGKLGYSPEDILYRVRFIDPATSFRNRAYYSNVGYFIAGQVLERLSHRTWEEAVRNIFLLPLNMSRSGFSANLDNPNAASAHALIDGNMTVIPWDRTGGFPAAGAVTSTAEDMTHWMIMFLNGGVYRGKQILQPKTVQALIRPSMVGEISFSEAPPIDENTGFDYSLGWNSYHYKGHHVIEKGGGLDGIRTLVTLIPDLKLGITILTNLNLTFLPEAIRARFLEVQLGKSDQDLQTAIHEKEKEVAKLLEKEPRPKNALPPGHSLDHYTGVFENDLYGSFRVFVKDDKLIVQAGPSLWTGTLTPFSNDTFILEWPTINSGNQKATFTFGPDDRPIELQTETLGEFHVKLQN